VGTEKVRGDEVEMGHSFFYRVTVKLVSAGAM